MNVDAAHAPTALPSSSSSIVAAPSFSEPSAAATTSAVIAAAATNERLTETAVATASTVSTAEPIAPIAIPATTSAASPTAAAASSNTSVKLNSAGSTNANVDSSKDVASAAGKDNNKSNDAGATKAWGLLTSLNEELPSFRLAKVATAAAGASEVGNTNLGKGAAGSGYLCGRHRECDIVINNQQLSKRHCLIFKASQRSEFGGTDGEGGHVYIEDMSTNGTYVNGEKIQKNKRHRLFDGDEIQLARYDPKKSSNSFHDQYILTDALGSGNFATVRLGKRRDTGQSFAVKIVDKKRFKGKPKMAESIKQEVSILTAINHPCVIHIAGVFDTDESVNIVMELARGGELFDLIIDKKKFTESEARVIMLQIFSVLQYLHERDIVHRDLKPENILLVSKKPGDFRLKISDFGLAKLVGEDSFMKTLCGTPNYVAPEVLSPAAGRAYGKAVDLWSCGVILYICLCGFPPFSEELAPPSMSEQIKGGLYNFPSPYWDEVSAEAIDLVKKLMTVDPDTRLTAEEAINHPWFQVILPFNWITSSLHQLKQLDMDRLKQDPNLTPIFSSTIVHLADFRRGDTFLSAKQDEPESGGLPDSANGDGIKRKLEEASRGSDDGGDQKRAKQV
ncbi:kinase-like domain-containing protein [Zopfochytrium polystomum]|nr:kinase-like domain-containing protein [Zopfochytrium polystomum]